MLLLLHSLQFAQWTSICPLPQCLFEFRYLLPFFSTLPGDAGCQPLPLSLLLFQHRLHFHVVLAGLKSTGNWGMIHESLVFADWTTWHIWRATWHYALLDLTAHALANATISKSDVR